MERVEFPYYQYQYRGIRRIMRGLTETMYASAKNGQYKYLPQHGFLLCDEMGMGKTVQAWGVLDKLAAYKENKPSLILVPSACMSSWNGEDYKRYFSHFELHYEYNPDEWEYEGSDVFIFSYAYWVRTGQHEMKNVEFKLLIMDEVHRLKNPQSQTSKAVEKIKRMYSLGLSGTPIVNHGGDMFTLLKVALKMDLNMNSVHKNPDGPYVKQILRDVMLVRKKNTVKDEQKVRLEWTNRTRNYYRALKRTALVVVEQYLQNLVKSTHVLAQMQKLRQACLFYPKNIKLIEFLCVIKRVCPVLYDNIEIRLLLCRHLMMQWETPKMRYLLDYVNSVGGEKVVCTSTYRSFLGDYLRPYLYLNGIRSVLFQGNGRKKQQRALKSFETDPNIRVMLMVKTAGALGLNLQHASRHCIIMDPHFNEALDQQAAQRIDRVGQNEKAVIRRLFMRGSIDEAIEQMQIDKQKDIDDWMTKKGGKNTMNVYSLFLKEKDTV